MKTIPIGESWVESISYGPDDQPVSATEMVKVPYGRPGTYHVRVAMGVFFDTTTDPVPNGNLFELWIDGRKWCSLPSLSTEFDLVIRAKKSIAIAQVDTADNLLQFTAALVVTPIEDLECEWDRAYARGA